MRTSSSQACKNASLPTGSSFFRLSMAGYSDLPLPALALVACFAAFCGFLENFGCNQEQNAAVLPVYVPNGFPCGISTLRQAVWLLRHPSRAFLLSADPSHRCWMFLGAIVAGLTWLAFIVASSASYRLGQRSVFLCALRIAPAAGAFAQLAFQGPTSSAAYVYRGNIFKMVALVQSTNTALGSRTLYLVSSLTEFLLFLANVYLLSMHGHAPWTLAHVAGAAATTLGAPMVLRACMARSRRATAREGIRLPPGDQSTAGFSCHCKAAAPGAAAAEGTTDKASISALSPLPAPARSACPGPLITDEAPASTPSPDVPLPPPAPSSALSTTAPVAPSASSGATGSGSSVPLGTTTCANGSSSSVPSDDPEKWESVILIRRLLAQPVPEWQPMYTRQRISVKVRSHAVCV